MPLGNFIAFIIGMIDKVIVPLVFAIAFIVFIWGVFQYFIAGAGNEEKRNEGKQFVLYGLIGFFLMLSVWGIVNLLVGSFGFGAQARPNLPTFGGGAGGGSQQVTTCTTGGTECSAGKSCVGGICR